MRQLADLLIEKKKKFGGWAEIGRLLGGRDGQLIGKYASGKIVPALDFAIDWKKAFNENLIDLMADEPPPLLAEPVVKYESEIIVMQQKLIDCMAARIKLDKEIEDIKKQLTQIK